MTMTKDQELYSNIGQTLFDAIPDDDATKVFLSVSIAEDEVELRASFLDKSGQDISIEIDDEMTGDLVDDIIELHGYFSEELKSPWHQFDMQIELPDGTLQIDFAYD